MPQNIFRPGVGFILPKVKPALRFTAFKVAEKSAPMIELSPLRYGNNHSVKVGVMVTNLVSRVFDLVPNTSSC